MKFGYAVRFPNSSRRGSSRPMCRMLVAACVAVSLSGCATTALEPAVGDPVETSASPTLEQDPAAAPEQDAAAAPDEDAAVEAESGDVEREQVELRAQRRQQARGALQEARREARRQERREARREARREERREARREARERRQRIARRTRYVARVIDGDTLELANGVDVRIVGIDTPERGECGFDAATANMERLVLGRRVLLRVSDENADRYGRLLRYVNVGKIDAGHQQIRAGLAIARYDSRDGYGYHDRENRYIASDTATPQRTCARPKPQTLMSAGSGCEPGYAPCVPSYPPDVNCDDVRGPVQVTGPDPHGLDGEGDGVGCE